MNKKIVVTLLFFIFSAGCALTGTYVHDSKSEEDYSQYYRECDDKAHEIARGMEQRGAWLILSLHRCMKSSGWRFVDEQGNERDVTEDYKKKLIWSPKNKLSGPSRFQGF